MTQRTRKARKNIVNSKALITKSFDMASKASGDGIIRTQSDRINKELRSVKRPQELSCLQELSRP